MPQGSATSLRDEVAAEPSFPPESLPRYGHHPLELDSDSPVMRIGFLNLRGFPTHASSKAGQLRQFINQYQFNIFGYSELNTNWSVVPATQRPFELFRRWLGPSHTSIAFNIHQSHGPRFVSGGAGLTTLGETTSRVLESGSDPTGLGRWTWQSLRGKAGRVVRVYSAYCPVNSQGPTTVYSQHIQYFTSLSNYVPGSPICPRQQFVEDLGQELAQRQQAGDLVIVGLDSNFPLTSRNAFTNMMRNRGLVNPILALPDVYGPPPPTRYPGGNHIDGIFMSSGLSPISCGLLSIDDGPAALDHVTVWMDIPVDHLFGYRVPRFITPSPQRLKPHVPATVAKFQQLFHTQALMRNLYEKLSAYQARLPFLTSEDRAHEWTRLWLLTRTISEHAERHCSKLHLGAHGFSEEWQQIVQGIDFWRSRIRQPTGQKANVRTMLRLARQAGVMHLTQGTLSDAEAGLSSALARKRLYKSSSRHKRQDYLDSLAQMYADKNQDTAANALRALKSRESTRIAHRRVKFALNNATRRGITVVTAPDPLHPDSRREYTDRAGVEAALLRENQSRFKQARTTPFLQEPLFSRVGRIGLNEFTDYILNHGTFPPDFPASSVEHCVHRLLPYLKRPPGVQPQPWKFDPISYALGWRKMPHTTSASPFGWSFAQVKALTEDARLVRLPTLLAWAPFAFGFTPPAWTQTVNTMLEKKRNNFNVEKLRAIALLDSLFNHNNKLLGNQLMAVAEEQSLVAKEQYGSRKRKQCIDQSLNKLFTTDFWRQTRISGVLCTTDLKSCYDRVVHSVATICSQRWGAHPSVLRSAYGTLADLQFFVRTSYGDSLQSFTGTPHDPIHGLCQGNGHGPATWACVSSPVFDMLRAEGHGASLLTPITKQRLSYLGFSFVDDTDVVSTGATPTEALQRMQDLLNALQDGLRVTGGQLVPEKSCYYLVSTTTDSTSQLHYTPISPSLPHLTLRAGDRDVPLSGLSVNHAERTLGVWLAFIVVITRRTGCLKIFIKA